MAIIIVYITKYKIYILSNDKINSGNAIRSSLTCFYHDYNKWYCLMEQNVKNYIKRKPWDIQLLPLLVMNYGFLLYTGTVCFNKYIFILGIVVKLFQIRAHRECNWDSSWLWIIFRENHLAGNWNITWYKVCYLDWAVEVVWSDIKF